MNTFAGASFRPAPFNKVKEQMEKQSENHSNIAERERNNSVPEHNQRKMECKIQFEQNRSMGWHL